MELLNNTTERNKKMASIWETLNETLIPNTTMEQRRNGDVVMGYRITPNEGYVLHDKGRDMTIFDPETHEVIGMALGYTAGSAACGVNYAFTPVIVTDENGVQFTAYGDREFAARLAADVPADHIFGVGDNNDHEVM